MHKTILGFESSCRKWGSAFLADIAMARSAWKQKHTAVLAAADQVLATELPQQRLTLDERFDALALEMEQKLESAPKEERARWCADFPEKIASDAISEQACTWLGAQLDSAVRTAQAIHGRIVR